MKLEWNSSLTEVKRCLSAQKPKTQFYKVEEYLMKEKKRKTKMAMTASQLAMIILYCHWMNWKNSWSV